MFRYKNVVILLLTATLILSLLPSFTTIHVQSQEQANERAQQFIEIALQAREKAYELRDFVLENMAGIPDEIEDLLEEGDVLLGEGDIPNAIQAMNKYRNAYRHLHRFIEQNGVDMETPEKARGLIVAINRTYIRIENYNKTLMAINETLTEDQYLNLKPYFECVQGNLTEAKENLELAYESLWLEPVNVTWAANNLTLANINIQESIHCFRMIAKGFNRWRIRSFLIRMEGLSEQIQERIGERIRQGILGDLLENLGYTNLEDFQQTINELVESVQENVENIKDSIEDLTFIVEKLREMAQNLRENRGSP